MPDKLMKLVVFSHKPCWQSHASASGYATDGGFPIQMAALANLFEHTRILVPVAGTGPLKGEMPLGGKNIEIVPLLPPFGKGWLRKMLFPVWLVCTTPRIVAALLRSDAVHAPIPGDVGTVGMLLAWMLRKPLFVRHCGNWLKPVTFAERFWRWFMEAVAGGRNVMLATGGAAESPSQKNSNVQWIFSSSLTREELSRCACSRKYPSTGNVRLVIAARQEIAKGAGTVVRALPRLAKTFPGISLEIIGQGSAIPDFKRMAKECNVTSRVHFPGKLSHDQVMCRLGDATLFVFPTTSSDGFPKAVLEGLASGLPVVATRVSVLPELIGSGCGVLINGATPDAVAWGVEQALADASRYEAMSHAAIEMAQRYSLEAWRDRIQLHLSPAWGPLNARQYQELKSKAAEGTAAVLQPPASAISKI